MSMTERLPMTGWLVILATIFIAYLLVLVPLPHWVEPFRPAWVALVLLYWAIVLPHRVGLVIAWFCGLVLDVVYGTVLGANALGLVVITYIAITLHRRIRLLPVFAQSGAIWCLLLLYQAGLFWLQGMQGVMVSYTWLWASPLIGAALWPWLFDLLTACLRRYRLH